MGLPRVFMPVVVGAVVLCLASFTEADASGPRLAQPVAALDPDAEVDLVLEVPQRPETMAHNVRVGVVAPDGWQAVSCTPEASWTCSIRAQEPAAVSFVKDADAPRGKDETFRFRLRTPLVGGDYRLEVGQEYSDGEALTWGGAPGSPDAGVDLTVRHPGAAPVDASPAARASAAEAPPAPLQPAPLPPQETPYTNPDAVRAGLSPDPVRTILIPPLPDDSPSLAEAMRLLSPRAAARAPVAGPRGVSRAALACSAVIVAAGAAGSVALRRRRSPGAGCARVAGAYRA